MTFVLHPLSHYNSITEPCARFLLSLLEHHTVVCAIDAATVKYSEAQFRSRQTDSVAPPSRSTPSRFTPSSSTSDMSLGDIMAQLECMDARLDTLSTELYQVNVRVGRIVRR